MEWGGIGSDVVIVNVALWSDEASSNRNFGKSRHVNLSGFSTFGFVIDFD